MEAETELRERVVRAETRLEGHDARYQRLEREMGEFRRALEDDWERRDNGGTPDPMIKPEYV